MKRLTVFIAILFSALVWAQAPGGAASLLAPTPSAPPSDVSSLPVAGASLPRAPTELSVQPGRLSAGSDAKGKPTAGDVVFLKITPPSAEGAGAKPEGAIGGQLRDGPVEWGKGRILWWKPLDPKSGVIVVALTSYSPGKFEIEPIPFEKDGKPVFASDAKDVEFAQVGGDKTKDDIYQPSGIGLPAWFLAALALITLGLVLVALNYAAKWYKQRKAEAKALATAPRILSPVEQFESARMATDAKRLVEKASFKPHYFALSDAAKRLLGQAFRFDAEERTTRELLRELEGLGMSVELLDQWEKILDEMDVTKFTDQTPEKAAAASLSERLARVVAESWSISPVAREILVQSQQARQKGGK